jgi:hypothetical protein
MAKKKIEVAPPPNARPFFTRQLPLAVLLVAAAGLYIAAGVLSGQFSLADDYGYIVQYGHYDRPLNLTGLAQMFNGISKQEMLHDYYRPIYTLIRSIDYRLYGTSPCGFHVTSLLFYLLAVGSAYWIFRKLVPSVLAAFFGALLFAFHPIHVEAVAWIMAGGYAIAGALALLSFALYLSKRTWASTLAFAAAALTNPPAVVVPALVCGHMWLFPRGGGWGAAAAMGEPWLDVGGGDGRRVFELRRLSPALCPSLLRLRGGRTKLAGQLSRLPATHGVSLGPANSLRRLRRKGVGSTLDGGGGLPGADRRGDHEAPETPSRGGLRFVLVPRGRSSHAHRLEERHRHGRPLCVHRILRAHSGRACVSIGSVGRRPTDALAFGESRDGAGRAVSDILCRRHLATRAALARYRGAVHRHAS